jgi:hypothetical protein
MRLSPLLLTQMSPSGYSKSRDVTILGAVATGKAGLVGTAVDDNPFQLKSILLSMARRQEPVDRAESVNVTITGAAARGQAAQLLGATVTIRIDDD